MKCKIATAAAVLCTALPSMAFFKVESRNTINKDGSAKFSAVVEFDLTSALGMIGQAGAKNPLGDGKEILVQLIKGMNSTVDVWTDAKAETTKGGATRISFSGFTKDWRAAGDFRKALAASGQQLPIPLEEMPDIKFMDMKNDSSGNSVITVVGLDDIGTIIDAVRGLVIKQGAAPKPGDMKVEEAEIEQGLSQARAAWPGIKGAVSPIVKGISIKTEIEVSGTISSSSVFKKTGENTATFSFTGDQLLSLADQIIADEELPGKIVSMVKSVEENFDNPKSTAAIKTFAEPYLKTVFGGDANPKIVVKPGKDAFDYAAETEKAKAAQSDELKALIEQAGKPGVKLPGKPAAPKGKKAA